MMDGLRRRPAPVIGGVAAAALYSVVVSTQAMPGTAAVFPLAIVRAGSVTRASCSLIARRDSPRVTVLYFATAARLFAARRGDAPIAAVSIERTGGAIAISPDNMILPTGLAVDVTLLRAVVASEPAQPLAVGFDPAPPAPFTVLPALASVLALHAADCIGAAAIADGRAFGVVTDCPPGPPPTVSPFLGARALFERYVRYLFGPQSASPRLPR